MLSSDNRRRLIKRLAAARAASDSVFRLVQPGYLHSRPIAERHRIIFYVGHLEAFDANLLRPMLGLKGAAPSLDKLFAFGIDPVDGSVPSDRVADWPTLKQVHAYVRHTREHLDQALADVPEDGSLSDAHLNVALEHRWMHVETLTYMLHQMPANQKVVPERLSVPEGVDREAPAGRMIEIPSGDATLGAVRGAYFGWDNEFDEHRVPVPAFLIDQHKVTNGQFLEFVRQGGYQDASLWTEEGWVWRNRAGITHPVFWEAEGATYRYKGMFGPLSLPAAWPVYVSYAEASAFAAWAGKRLPTEAEWHRAAYGTPSGERPYPWGDAGPDGEHGYLGMEVFDPHPVDAFPASRSYWGIEGLVANGWEWTSSEFAPFPGFQPFPFYLGYSADFFDGKHYVMKGGSPRTERSMLRRSFRNWFQPHYPYAYAGFRCAKDI